MQRRQFITTASAFFLSPTLLAAYEAEDFTPGLWDSVRGTDRTVILNYRATWSLTCQIKADILAQLLAENPDYARLTFIEVDWDTFGPSEMTKRLRVERRSTLLVMKKGDEIARLVNEPYERRIRALLDTALAA